MAETMPLSEVLNLYSSEYDGRVKDILRDVMLDHSFYDDVINQMLSDRINAIPILIGGDRLINGHHRVKIADMLALKTMRITTDSDELYRYWPRQLYKASEVA